MQKKVNAQKFSISSILALYGRYCQGRKSTDRVNIQPLAAITAHHEWPSAKARRCFFNLRGHTGKSH
jgi:hypothetical protein